jgi:type IV secretory pathway TraG/TraD family ATPase VirD4
MANALAQARGYGVGMVLAHQNLAQLKDSELQKPGCPNIGPRNSKYPLKPNDRSTAARQA